ncbi:MAG: single-stranded DNA-binding protein [Bacteroidota bacterium]|nr:single-stranded DNA-binding protein [Bacteroidota bacterium]MDX5404420.1 single-stranded DNA-binding protein [Bacteroidota bacterium]MDX5426596.1 single-stranded DNA-binding protein [Bacteroidota bacterium]MDX5449081.1 single-stranded DNA-binding protein [Bacteroidota bacterium]MDX5504605.1 single-stranded DNA-binding protein [Bacteroidota bacterium]
MSTLNKVMLIANLGKDPEVKHFEGGGMLVRFPVATTETYNNREGNRVEQTEWHNIVVTRRGLAEVCERYLKKGMKVYLEGRLKTRQWEENGQTRYMTEINIDNMTMLTSKQEAENMQGSGSSQPADDNRSSSSPSPAPSGGSSSFESSEDDDLPF